MLAAYFIASHQSAKPKMLVSPHKFKNSYPSFINQADHWNPKWLTVTLISYKSRATAQLPITAAAVSIKYACAELLSRRVCELKTRAHKIHWATMINRGVCKNKERMNLTLTRSFLLCHPTLIAREKTSMPLVHHGARIEKGLHDS